MIAFFVFAIGMAIKIHKKQATTGAEGMIGEVGVVFEDLDPEGKVQIHGEFWKAVSDTKIEKGRKVEVIKYQDKGLMLKVKLIS